MRASPPTTATRVTNGGTRPHELGGPAAGEDPGVGVGILDDEAERVGAFLDAMAASSGWVIPQILTLTATPVSGGQPTSARARIASAGSGAWRMEVPTRTASAPAARARRASSGPAMALSERSTLPGGSSGDEPFGEADVAVVDLADLDVAVVDAEDVGPQPEVDHSADVLVVVDLDEGLEAPLPGGGVEPGQRLVVEHADGEEDGVGPGLDRLVEVALRSAVKSLRRMGTRTSGRIARTMSSVAAEVGSGRSPPTGRRWRVAAMTAARSSGARPRRRSPSLGERTLISDRTGMSPFGLAAADRRRQAAGVAGVGAGRAHPPAGAMACDASANSASLRLAAPESMFSWARRRPSSGLLAAPAT